MHILPWENLGWGGGRGVGVHSSRGRSTQEYVFTRSEQPAGNPVLPPYSSYSEPGTSSPQTRIAGADWVRRGERIFILPEGRRNRLVFYLFPSVLIGRQQFKSRFLLDAWRQRSKYLYFNKLWCHNNHSSLCCFMTVFFIWKHGSQYFHTPETQTI